MKKGGQMNRWRDKTKDGQTDRLTYRTDEGTLKPTF